MFNFSYLMAAGGAATKETQPWESSVLMIVIMALMLFLFWFMGRKQRKQQKIMNERRNNLKNGDKVMMSCGIYGTVIDITDIAVTIRTGGADGTNMVFNRQYVAVVEYDDDAEDMSQKEAENANK